MGKIELITVIIILSVLIWLRNLFQKGSDDVKEIRLAAEITERVCASEISCYIYLILIIILAIARPPLADQIVFK